jgi:predicted enzyme related to lactoylglutathione lyase
MQNGVVHFEVAADDMERAKKFYAQAFGWKMNDWQDMTFVSTVETGEDMMPSKPGVINGDIYKRKAGEPTSIVVGTDSIEETIEKVKAAGGIVTQEKETIPDMGSYAQIKDTEGNIVGLWEEAKK